MGTALARLELGDRHHSSVSKLPREGVGGLSGSGEELVWNQVRQPQQRVVREGHGDWRARTNFISCEFNIPSYTYLRPLDASATRLD